MQIPIHFRILLISLIFLTAACKSGKNTTDVRLKKRSSKEILKNLKANELDFEWFTAKVKVKLRDSTQNRNVSVNLRMKKDSVIWMSIGMLGVEGVRVLVRPDSVFVVNRLDKEYIAADLGLIERQLNLPANFGDIQQLLVGNPVFYNQTKFKSKVRDGEYQLTGSDDDMRSTYRINKNYLLTRMDVEDFASNRSVTSRYGAYKELDNARNFSYFRKIQVESVETGSASIEMDFSKVAFDKAKRISFRVPKNYKKR